MKTLLLVGSTGLVGQALLQQALADRRVGRIVAPTRRALPKHPKLDNQLVDFDRLPADAPWWKADAVICTLGTTIKVAGSQAAFRRVDYDYPLEVAKLALEHGTNVYALNSAMGANPKSGVFYNRTKGELEQALGKLGYASLTLVRPGLIGGTRATLRPAEHLGVKVLGALGPLLPRRMRVVPAERIAACLLEAALKAEAGCRAIESQDM